MLPNAKTLHVLRNQGDDHGDARVIRQVHTEADQEVPQVESPRGYSGRTSSMNPNIQRHQPEEDQRETEARRLYSGGTSGRPPDIRRPATGRTSGTCPESGACYPESRRIGHSSSDIRPKAWTSGASQSPGHPAPSLDIRRLSAQSERARCPFIPTSHLPLRGLTLYILPHLLLVRVSKGLAHM